MSDLPEPWATWASKAGIRASLTGIGEAAGGLPASTISRLVNQGKTSPATVEAVAAALRVAPGRIMEAATGAEGYGPWNPPLESHLLTTSERDALSVIIRSITSGRAAPSQSPADPAPASPARLRPVPEWAARTAARELGEPKGVPEPVGDEDFSQDPEDY
ncbi:hypothetical protein [Propionibacterium australiense]|uniref:hypothetical protein n=1 Tax=Propionibacterium australiense TaxID=119981 RepID=UPI0011C43AB0|nr:hypothetical protein [Propionibacterium australiense]